MRRWMPALALGALLAVVAIAVVVTTPRSAPATAERADALARELRCPDCQGLSVADSPTRSAQEIRRQIDELLAAGSSDEEVRDHFVARYGQWILLAPSGVAYWVIPFAAVVAGGSILVAWLARRAPRAAAPPRRLSDEERRSLHEETEALDA